MAEEAAENTAPARPPTLEELLAEHYGWALQRAQRLLAWHAAAEDVVQEAFLKAAGKLPTLRDPAKARAWLGQVVLNRCRSWRRREAVRRRLLPWRAREVAPPERQAAADETARSVRQAVAALPAKEREAVVLRYFEGLPLAEVAAALGERQNTVEVRLHRARGKLAVVLAEWRDE